MTTTPSTDCLIFKIQEFIDNELDTTLFIFYDKNEETYFIRGKRSDTPVLESFSYSFTCKYAKDVVNFISLVLCPKSKISYTIYCCDDLPCDSDDITYTYLDDICNDRTYELSGFDNQKLNRKYLTKTINTLKYVFNYY
jgi:hypothetical protein